MDGELNAPQRSGDGEQDLSPLNFLLTVMKDPDATPKQRIRAAKIAARYKHAAVLPDKMPSTDEYGFAISRTLAKEICEDDGRLDCLEKSLVGLKPDQAVAEATEIRARQAERYQVLQCPPGYSPERDVQQWAELIRRRRRARGLLSKAEETEFDYVVARMTAYDAGIYRTACGQARRRIEQLEAASWMRKVDRSHATIEEWALDLQKLELTAAEESELQQLRKDFPRSSWPKAALDDYYLAEKKNREKMWEGHNEFLRRLEGKKAL